MRSASQQVCDARLMPGRVVAQAARANRRPARFFVRTPRLLHRRVTVWPERNRIDPLRGHDSAALQNKTALVSGADRLLASLEPIGVLAAPQCPITTCGAVTRRSPRGPPPAPGFA